MARCAVCGDELMDASRQFCGGDRCDRVLLPRQGRQTGVWLGRVLPVALTLLFSLAVTQAADGQVPTPADIAACNEEAPRAVKAGAASPNGGDHARADSARGGGLPATSSTAATSGGVESSDPQIHGMQRAGANNAAYQAAYRSCMRRKGF
jgi:hypothetical protein